MLTNRIGTFDLVVITMMISYIISELMKYLSLLRRRWRLNCLEDSDLFCWANHQEEMEKEEQSVHYTPGFSIQCLSLP
jgi:hypothetical protein